MPRGPPLAKTWPNPIGCTVVLPSGGLSHTLERRPFHMPFDHDAAAAATLYWYDESTWWRYDTDGGCWRGWTVSDGADGPSISLATEKRGPVSKWRPWGATLDKSESPYARWFVGGRTNSSFNCVDKHVLEGHGADIACVALARARMHWRERARGAPQVHEHRRG